jgi:CBS-domain-containing membrane protein
MTHAVTTVTRRTTMRELETLFEQRDFNSFPVVEEGKMLEIVTKFDFLPVVPQIALRGERPMVKAWGALGTRRGAAHLHTRCQSWLAPR